MSKFNVIILLFCITANVIADLPKSTRIRNRYALSADKGFVSQFAYRCLEAESKFELLLNMENLIELVERLENEVANKTELAMFNSPEKIARMFLQRFNLDSIDLETMQQDQTAEYIANIDSKIIGLMSGLKSADYEFPDYIFTEEELCTLLFMFSHNFGSHSSIEEQGVVEFNVDNSEAIAPARLFAGIIAAMAEHVELSGKAISSKVSGSAMTNDVRLSDAVLAVTLGSQMGSASFYEFQSNPNYDTKLIYAVYGGWINETYLISNVANLRALKFSHRASLAEMRGALDGYIIGKSLQLQSIKLTVGSILGLYYSAPQVGAFMNKLGVSYCQRSEHLPGKSELKQMGLVYNQIFNFVTSKENSVYKGDLLIEELSKAAKTQPDFCNWKPSSKKTYKVQCRFEEL